MKHITCIICPIGCHIIANVVDGEYVFFGNKCPKGVHFAKTELIVPVRSLTTTVRTAFPETPVLPVRTNGEVPKEKITEIIRELAKVTVTERIGIGETVAVNISGTGCDIIVTSDMLRRNV
jgi:CxxC motif-containing protein